MKLRTLDLAGTQAAGADGNGRMFAVNDSLDFSDVRLPGSVGFAVGMGVVVPEGHTLAADAALCHVRYTSIHRDITKSTAVL